MPERPTRRSYLVTVSAAGLTGLAGCGASSDRPGDGGQQPTDTATETPAERPCSLERVRQFGSAAAQRQETYTEFGRLYNPDKQTAAVADEALPSLADLVPTPRAVDAIQEARSFSREVKRSTASQILETGAYSTDVGDSASPTDHETATETNDELATLAGSVKQAAETYVGDPTHTHRETLVAALQSERDRLETTPTVKDWATLDGGQYPQNQGIVFDDGIEYIRQFASANLESFDAFDAELADQLACLRPDGTPTPGESPTTEPTEPSGEPTTAAGGTVSGRLVDPTGAPVTTGEAIALGEPEGLVAVAPDATGEFQLDLTGASTYTLQYTQGANGYPDDGLPDLYTIGEISPSSAGDLGTIRLPAAYDVSLTVETATGAAVTDEASVFVEHQRNGSTSGFELIHNPIELVGDVSVSGEYESETATRELTITDSQSVTLTLG